MKRLCLANQKINFLKITEDFESRKDGVYWRCICDCGNQYWGMGSLIKRGKVVSCGCYGKSVASRRSTTHGMSKTPIYKIWTGLKDRCYNPNSTNNYAKYGALGVRMCESWFESFESFYLDMGDCPEGHSLNRIHGSKLYSKETCEWATLSVQAFDQKVPKNNTSGRVGVNFDITDELWVAQINVSNKVVKKRFKSFDDACEYREELEMLYFGFTKGTDVTDKLGE